MKMVRLISFISRVFFMITLVLGVVYWIAQLPFLSGFLTILAQINVTSIHKASGFLGVFGLFILGSVVVFKRESRSSGLAGILYAFLVPVFGLTQAVILVGPLHLVVQATHLLVGIGAMYLARGIEKRYQRLKPREQGTAGMRPQDLIGHIAVLANTTTREQGGMSAQPQGRPYPPIVAGLARVAVAAHVALYRLSGGKIGGKAQRMPILLLTTTGRKSGKPRATALVYLPEGEDFVVVASNGGQARLPNWWLNMRKSKQAQREVGRERLRVSVEEAYGEERERLWSRIIAYGAGHEAYQERTPYPLPVVILHPEEALS